MYSILGSKIILRFCFVAFVLSGSIACNPNGDRDSVNLSSYEARIMDSLLIDHLGNLWLLDYDFQSETYMSWGTGQRDLLLISKKGEIVSQFDIPSDGPNRIGSITSLDFENGEVRILENPGKIVHLNGDGEIVKKIDFPVYGFYLNGIAGDPYFPFKNEIAFVRPEKELSQEDIDWDEFYETGFQKIYQQPILEVLDTMSMKSRLTMEFPKESIYQDGKFYNWMFPTVTKEGKNWMLYFRGEMKFFLYQEVDNEIVFSQVVDLNVVDAVPAVGIPFDQIDEYDELRAKSVSGNIQSIIPTSDGYFVLYKKGLKEDEIKDFDLNSMQGRMAMQRSNPYFLALLDDEFNLIQNDIQLPKGVIYSRFLSPEGTLLGLKDQDYFGVEEDRNCYYFIAISVSK